jgi:hypothetical protein
MTKKTAKTLSKASKGKISEKETLDGALELLEGAWRLEEISKFEPKEFNPETCASFYENWAKKVKMSKSDKEMLDMLIVDYRCEKIQNAVLKRGLKNDKNK